MSDGMLNFPSENDNLTEIKVKSWNNLLFTTLSSEIKFEELFTEIDKRVSWMQKVSRYNFWKLDFYQGLYPLFLKTTWFGSILSRQAPEEIYKFGYILIPY